MNYFTVATEQGHAGILFETEDANTVIATLRLEAVRPWLSYPIYLYRVGLGGDSFSGLFASEMLPRMRSPDKAEEADLFHIIYADKVIEYYPYARFDACTQLIKVMGCEHCDLNGEKCVTQFRPEYIYNPDPDKVTFDADKFLALINKQELVWGEHRSVKPILTRIKHFEPAIRSAHKHDFTCVSSNVLVLKNIGEQSAQTKKLTANNCTRCLFKFRKNDGKVYAGCGGHINHCHGPYKSAEEQIKALNTEGDAMVESFISTSEYTPGQFWTIARMAGLETRHNRQLKMLGGWRLKGKVLDISIHRSRVLIHRTDDAVNNYGELREIFDDLPKEGTHQAGPPPAKIRAMWYASLSVNGLLRSSGWGSRWRDIVSRRVSDRELYLRIAAERYIFYSGLEFTDVAMLYLTLSTWPPEVDAKVG